MQPASRRWPVCWLVIACAVARPCLSQECSAERMADTIVDINLSLPKGIRGAEPLYAPNPEACVRACCSGEKLSGNRLLFHLFCDCVRAALGKLLLKLSGIRAFSIFSPQTLIYPFLHAAMSNGLQLLSCFARCGVRS